MQNSNFYTLLFSKRIIYPPSNGAKSYNEKCKFRAKVESEQRPHRAKNQPSNNLKYIWD